MLHTSMTGGISRALTSELRAFLLKEEGGLADTLQRMRGNLDACRRTRTEVQESRRLEQEIGGVFEAGQTMFAAAFLATRERAAELGRRVDEAEAARVAAVEAHAAAKAALDETLAQLGRLESRRGELGEELERARVLQARLREALLAAKALARCAEQLGEAERAAEDAARKRSEAEAVHSRKREELRRAQEGYKRAATGLADMQSGIGELHRRAGAHLQAVKRLREAEHCFSAAPLLPESFAERLSSAAIELHRVDEERREAATRLADAEEHRKRHAELMEALRALAGSDVDAGRAHDLAMELLQRHREQVALAGRLPAIDHELAEACQQHARQTRAREQAKALGVAVGGEPAADLVGRLHDEVTRLSQEHEGKERSARDDGADTERQLKALEARRGELAAREPQWREHASRASRIARATGAAVDSRPSLDTARATLGDRLRTAGRLEDETREAEQRLHTEARELLAAGGPFAPELLELRDRLDAVLVAASFEDTALDEAARLEARLGGLAQALVVDEPLKAARVIADRPDSLSDVLIVSREADLEALAAATNAVEVGQRDVAVNEGLALRVSRIPTQPRLGRRARNARAAQLQREAEAKAVEVEGAWARRRELEDLVADGEALLAGHVVWLAGDPATELSTVKRSMVEAQAQLGLHRAASLRHAEAARELQPRIEGLRSLLGQAMLLDPPDHGERSTSLEASRKAAQDAKDAVVANGRHAELVDRQLATLRAAPLSDVELGHLSERAQQLRARRQLLDAGIDALSYVQANVMALSWEDAPRALDENRALVPALQAQLRDAEIQQVNAESAAKQAEARHGEATARFHDADGRRRVASQEHSAAVKRFEAAGILDPSELAIEAAARDVERLDLELKTQESDVMLWSRHAGAKRLPCGTPKAA